MPQVQWSPEGWAASTRALQIVMTTSVPSVLYMEMVEISVLMSIADSYINSEFF
jgi:hypothetical protein